MCVSEADLSRGFDAPDETEKDNKPRHSQAAQDRQTDFSKVPNIIRDVQHIVSERQRADQHAVLNGWPPDLGFFITGRVSVSYLQDIAVG